MKLFILHPGIQHSPRLANAAVRSNLFSSVTLLTSILFKPTIKTIGILKKRIKPIDKEVNIINHYFYTLLFEISKFLHNKIIVNRNNQSHNNPIYFWQQIFGYLCLPRIWLNRKDCMVICFETAGWPITKYCKKWGIPVIMDFASISHEKAQILGLNETNLGINIKIKERQDIDFAFFCSQFCLESFTHKTSSKKNYLLYLGADVKLQNNLTPIEENSKSICVIKICFIANTEFRKGLDILLDALLKYDDYLKLDIKLIGRLSEKWVEQYLSNNSLSEKVALSYVKSRSQLELFTFLQEEKFDIHILPSRFDSYGMVVPESMSLGIFNILSPYVGAGEMIEHQKDGYILKKLDAEGIIEGIKWWSTLNSMQKLNLKKNILAKAHLMSWKNYDKQVATVFNDLISKLYLEIKSSEK